MKNAPLNKANVRLYIKQAIEASIYDALEELGYNEIEANDTIEHLVKGDTLQVAAVDALCAYKRKLFVMGGVPKRPSIRLDDEMSLNVDGALTSAELGEVIAEQSRINAGA
ncbi:MAG: hypothetical protein CMA72_09215 [Euryarchaeota archaeon]|nr:hypothetical protein [Euryarchaeota archaeon]|tara:strand:+ start:2930 stop:3262 length:333 start_codon:yes stop_codon:yes gene_type:complete